MKPTAAMRSMLALALLVAALASGCGTDEEAPPRARTAQQWADRVVDRFLRDMNRDLDAVNKLNNLHVRLYLESGTQETVEVLETRLNDLAECSSKLERVGPPPEAAPPDVRRPLERVHTSFTRACVQYERLAELLLEALPLVASDDEDEKRQGRELFTEARRPSERAAFHYGRALDIASRQPAFRAAGLQGSG
ncbi:MAG: hypothetical protein M3M94_01955 [Actinomycetota bacterium]|nr:hypothetical protein [Actinomycetota bacterium]